MSFFEAALSGSSGSAVGQEMLGTRNCIHPVAGPVDTTNTRFETEVPRTAVENMFGVSGSTSVSTVGAVQADPSQPTLRVEALSPGKFSTKLVSLASISLTFHADADGSIAIHPVTSEDIPGRTLVVGLAPELQQNQTICVLIDTGAGLDSSGRSLVGLRGQ